MAKAKTKSQEIREAAQKVQVFATCGRMPLVPADTDWSIPHHPRLLPEKCLTFEDGVCTLNPADPEDAELLRLLHQAIEDGDDRIDRHHVQIVRGDAMRAPYPNWDAHTVSKVLSKVAEDGFDPSECLKYELQKDEPRKDLVEKLEELIDKPAPEDPLAVPTIEA